MFSNSRSASIISMKSWQRDSLLGNLRVGEFWTRVVGFLLKIPRDFLLDVFFFWLVQLVRWLLFCYDFCRETAFVSLPLSEAPHQRTRLKSWLSLLGIIEGFRCSLLFCQEVTELSWHSRLRESESTLVVNGPNSNCWKAGFMRLMFSSKFGLIQLISKSYVRIWWYVLYHML